MIAFLILLAFLSWAQTVVIGPAETADTAKLQENGTKELYMLNNAWQFESIDDCMDFRELRKKGWRGSAQDFYALKNEE